MAHARAPCAHTAPRRARMVDARASAPVALEFTTHARRGAATLSRKWNRFDGTSIPLWVADMDIKAPRAVIDAVTACAESGIYGYADADDAVVDAVRERMVRRYGWPEAAATRASVRWLPGLNPGLNHAVRAVQRLRGRDNSTVAMCTPIYPPFLYSTRNQEAARVEVPLRRRSLSEGGRARYDVDFEALDEVLAREDVHLLLFCNPANPVGRVWARDDIERIARMCVERDVYVLSDEVWAELVMDDVEFTGMGSMIDVVPGLAERLIVMASPSKAFNVAGTDVAFALIADKELRLAFARSGSDKAEITPFGYVALRAAYSSSNECEAWRQTLVKYLESQRAHIDARLTAIGASAHISWTYPECSYLMWIDCTQMMDKIPNNASPFTYFEERGVAFSDGAPFGRRECVRLNFATSRELLDEGLDRFIAAMDAL